jgi:hypothetical protein
VQVVVIIDNENPHAFQVCGRHGYAGTLCWFRAVRGDRSLASDVYGKRDRKIGAKACTLAMRRDGTPVQLDQVTDDREAKPESPLPSRRRAIELPESIENVGEKVRFDAIPVSVTSLSA